MNCWELKKCGREPNGSRVHESGVCPAALPSKIYRVHDGRQYKMPCWLIAGTFCHSEIQGTFAKKYDNCKLCDFYVEQQEAQCPYSVLKNILFGQYLREKGLISLEDTVKARCIQIKHNRKIGELAKEKGWLTSEDIDRILIIQEETLKKFGEIAVEKGYLSQNQVDELLKEQQDNYLFFGEALVKLGVISQEEIMKQLKEYNKTKFAK